MNTLLMKGLGSVFSSQVFRLLFPKKTTSLSVNVYGARGSRVQRVAKTMFFELVFMAMITPAVAVADPNIQLAMSVAKEKIVEENGLNVTRWIEAEDIEPGEKLRYTVTYANIGDEAATQVKIENPIPELTTYVDKTASGDRSNIVFSADGGQNYNVRSEVTYEVAVFGGGSDRRIANADRFTNIRWLIEEVLPGDKGEVSFQVVVQ